MKKEKTELEKMTEELADFALAWYVRKVQDEHQYYLKDVLGQFMRAATSVGANLAEARFAQSSADYVSKLSIARKESSEVRFWVDRLIVAQQFDFQEFEFVEARVESIINMLTAAIAKAKKSA